MARKSKYTASKSDKFVLYEKAVQNPDYDAIFVKRLYKRLRGREARKLKEDFCGTFAFACEWVKQNKENSAIGIDLDQPTLDWGRKNNLSLLKKGEQSRVLLKNANVLDFAKPLVDIVIAFNFSYFIFKSREELKCYFIAARKSLREDGIFFLDAFGGSEAYTLQEERRKCEGFTYVWDHADYSPVTGDILCKIHFEFPNGSKMKNAFTYDWRLWTLPEITELLKEAGFKGTQIFWEGTEAKTGEGNGIFRRTLKGEACQSWIAYIAALV